MTVPFKTRLSDRVAVVIMKNPSRAGIHDAKMKRKISDDTIYKVCDYLYKDSFDFSKVIILNLFPIFGPTFKSLIIDDPNVLLGKELNNERNNEVIMQVLNSIRNVPHKIILAWGGYPNMGDNLTKEERDLIRTMYKQRINEVLSMIGDRATYKVGENLSDGKFPPHGKVWYDYERMVRFSDPRL
nr:DUF1643 domain-containing protein [Halobacillus sp. KGW1]